MLRALFSLILWVSTPLFAAEPCETVTNRHEAQIRACYAGDLDNAQRQFAKELVDAQTTSGLAIWFSTTPAHLKDAGDLHVYSEIQYANGLCRQELLLHSGGERRIDAAATNLVPDCSQDWR